MLTGPRVGAVVFGYPVDARDPAERSVVGDEKRCDSLAIAENIVNLIEVGGKATDSEIKLGGIFGLRQGVLCGKRLAMGLLEAGDPRTGKAAVVINRLALRNVLFRGIAHQCLERKLDERRAHYARAADMTLLAFHRSKGT